MRLASLLIACVPSVAFANVMTFTDLGGKIETAGVYVEDGITATAVGLGASAPDAGTQHLDGQLPAPSWVDFTTGGLFQPVSVDISPLDFNYCPDSPCTTDTPYTNLWISGFLDGSIIASLSFSTIWDGWETLALDALGFVDQLRIEIKMPSDLDLPGSCTSSCGHLDLDNVTVAIAQTVSVPEPGALLLLTSGLAAIVIARRKRVK